MKTLLGAVSGVLGVADAPLAHSESCPHKHPQTPLSDSLIASNEVLGEPLAHLQPWLDIGPSEELFFERFHRNLLVRLTHNDAVVNRETRDAMGVHQLSHCPDNDFAFDEHQVSPSYLL